MLFRLALPHAQSWSASVLLDEKHHNLWRVERRRKLCNGSENKETQSVEVSNFGSWEPLVGHRMTCAEEI